MRHLPPKAFLNDELTAQTGDPVLLIDAIPITSGDCLTLRLESQQSPWRQGVYLDTAGMLEIAGEQSPTFVLWRDTAPPAVQIRVLSTDGYLRLYNVWDSGRGLGAESQAATSGMRRSLEADGTYRYGCTDFGLTPDFRKLTFTVSPRCDAPGGAARQ